MTLAHAINSTCARNLPQHFNGCACTSGGTVTSEADVDLDLNPDLLGSWDLGANAPALDPHAPMIPNNRVDTLGHALATALQGQQIDEQVVRDEARTGTTIIYAPGLGFRAYADSAWTEPTEQPMLPWSPPPAGEVVAKVHLDGSYEYPNRYGAYSPVPEALRPVTARIDTHHSPEDQNLITSAAQSLHSGDSGCDHRHRTYDLASHAMLGGYLQQREVNGVMHPMLARAAADKVHDDMRKPEPERTFSPAEHARLRLLLGLNKTTAQQINDIED